MASPEDLCLVALLLMGIVEYCCSLNHSPGYTITPFTVNTGIHYERIHSLRLSRATWRITIFLDTTQFINNGPVLLLNQLDRRYEECRDCAGETCDGIIRLHSLKERIYTFFLFFFFL